MAELPEPLEPLGSEADALLSSYRVQRGPPPGVEARMLASMHAQLGLLPGSGAGTSGGVGTGATGTATLASAGAASGGKLLALVSTVALTLAAGAGVLASRSASEPAERSVASSSSDETELEAAPPAEPSEAPDAKDLVLEPDPPDAESETDSGVVRRRRHTRPRRSAQTSAPLGLAEEAKLLRAADAALRRGSLAEAEALLERHRSSFKAGELGQQARELELMLACALGHPGAAQAALDHLHAQPKARARARIERQCGLD